MTDRLLEIRALCQRYNHPGVNLGTHALALAVIRIIEREPSVVKDKTVSPEQE